MLRVASAASVPYMSNSLRDQLLGLGFKSAPKPERKPETRPAHSANKPANKATQPQRPHAAKPARPQQARADQRKPHGKPRTREEIDLAKAYAIRAQKEKDERIEAERLKQEQARERREAKARVAELLKGKALNDPEADIARHFNYGGKIKRVHVNAAQLKALNAGELGVVQMDGRYLLVEAALLEQVGAIFPPSVALKVDPTASPADDPYADPAYQVPYDLVW